jgi:hypothetical protein
MLHSSPTKSQAIFGPMNLQWLSIRKRHRPPGGGAANEGFSMKAWLNVFGHPSLTQDTREIQVEGTFAFQTILEALEHNHVS